MIDGGLQRWNLSAEEPRLVDEKPLPDLAYYPSPTDGIYAQKRRVRDAVERWDFWESIVIRRAEDGDQVVELSDPGMSYVRSLAWSPDGRWLAASYDIDTEAGYYSHSKLAVWSATTWQVVRSFDNLSGSSWTLSWSPDSQWIAATDAPSSSNLTLYPLSDSQPILEIDAHQGMVESVAWSPNGRRIASSGYDGQLIIWDAATLLNEAVEVTPASPPES
jgi:WD40 repeat protein